MKLVINIPDYVKEQADDGKGGELGIPLWLAYEIANGTPIPDNASNRDVMKIIFPKIGLYDEWYDEPYQKGRK